MSLFFVLEESVLHNGGMYSESNHFDKDFCSKHVTGHELPRRTFFFFFSFLMMWGKGELEQATIENLVVIF